MRQWARRLLARFVAVLAFLLVNLYVWDWVLLRVRMSRGTAFGVVQSE